MHRRTLNNDFDILSTPQQCGPTNLQKSSKLQIPKIHKNIQKLSVICTKRVGCLDYHISSILSPKLTTLFGYLSPDFTLPDEQISNRVHNAITCVENM